VKQRPDTHSDGYEVKKLTGGPRFCRMCDKFKPPRAHHCRQCNRCVVCRCISAYTILMRDVEDVFLEWVRSNPLCHLLPSNLIRPSLSMGEQLRWAFQLWSLYPVPFLRRSRMFLSSCNGDAEGICYYRPKILGEIH
jgi:hypothetical protein